MQIECPNCSNVMKRINAHQYECTCGNWAYYDDGSTTYRSQTEDPDTWDYDEDSGCTACGNPDWPKCKDACPLYDD